MKRKKKQSELIITELILIMADFKRTYIGTIKRETDCEGKDVVCGSVTVNEGMIWAMVANEEELTRNLDSICILKLDKGLHSIPALIFEISNLDYFLN